jgi:hypothetical protein
MGVFLLENGRSEPFYLRFTSPKQNSLVLGNSKAAQGIIPDIINGELGRGILSNLYNYSFTINNSPYGPAYLNSIRKKLLTKGENHLFLVTVDPWSLSSNIYDPNNSNLFIENERFMGKLFSVDSSPNIQYLLLWFESQYFEILLSRIVKVHSILHEDGWYETGESPNPETSLNFMIDFYNKLLQESDMSQLRYEYLKETIDFLSHYGVVVLVRMPLHSSILRIENKLDPEFDLKMQALSKSFDIPYYNFSKIKNEFDFKDGIHLNKESAERFSKILAGLIWQSKSN